ncbi:MAG: hypothetical protein U0531_11375 [Dehalococcoidia bacterium]
MIETPPDAVRAASVLAWWTATRGDRARPGMVLHAARRRLRATPRHEDAPFLPVTPPLDEERARELARRFPGSHWLVGNEPNVAEGNRHARQQQPTENYARALERYARTIKDSDPTAKLVGPNVLNWTFLCIGCPGYALGIDWTTRMWASYVEQFGAPHRLTCGRSTDLD